TYEILKAQIQRYDELENDMNFLADFSNRQKVADFAGFIAFNESEEEVFTFGKYRGRTVKAVLNENPGYYSWIQNADFPLYTKKVLTAIRLREFNKG
ncbi:MAG: 3'-5' exonuclease, partial [Schleiferiaceae bacterium]